MEIIGLLLLLGFGIYQLFIKKRKLPLNWKLGDEIEDVNDHSMYTQTEFITHISPDRKTFILDNKRICYYKLLTKYRNISKENRKEQLKLNKVKEESEDYVQALKELDKKFN